MKKKKVEYRNFTPEIRAEGDEDYIFEGYATTFDTVDSYSSSFRSGAFKKTISERGDRIKILWNHNMDEPIGKIIEIREDSKGLFVRGLLTKGVTKADDVFKNLKAGVIDTLSFGFIPVQSKKVEGIRQITEVKLYEVSPVTFEANETAEITEVRDEDIKIPSLPEELLNKDGTLNTGEARAEDFDESLATIEAYNGGWNIMDALHETIWDIWWAVDESTVISKLDIALSKFHSSYLAWAKSYVDKFWETRKLAMSKNDLSKAFISENTESIEVMSQETSFTTDELKALSSGNILPKESRGKLTELPESIRSAHQQERSRVVEALCDELRIGGFSEAEKVRFNALLGLKEEVQPPSVVVKLAEIRESLNK